MSLFITKASTPGDYHALNYGFLVISPSKAQRLLRKIQWVRDTRNAPEYDTLYVAEFFENDVRWAEAVSDEVYKLMQENALSSDGWTEEASVACVEQTEAQKILYDSDLDLQFGDAQRLQVYEDAISYVTYAKHTDQEYTTAAITEEMLQRVADEHSE